MWIRSLLRMFACRYPQWLLLPAFLPHRHRLLSPTTTFFTLEGQPRSNCPLLPKLRKPTSATGCHENPSRIVGLGWLGMHLITHRSNSLHETLLGAAVKESIKVIAAQIFVIEAGFQHFVYGLEDAVRDGE